jgi:hypothetical protein
MFDACMLCLLVYFNTNIPSSQPHHSDEETT